MTCKPICVKKFSQLMIVEADEMQVPLAETNRSLFASFFEEVITADLAVIEQATPSTPQLILLHSPLTTIGHLQRFIQLQTAYPHSVIALITGEADDELCQLALEAGAEDVVPGHCLTKTCLNRMAISGQRQRQMANELDESRTQLMACIQNTPNVAVQWFNSKGEVLFWNNASERIFGWTAEEAKGKTIGQLILTPDEEKQFIASWGKLTYNGASAEPFEYFFRRRDGSQGYCISTLFRIESNHNEPLFVCMDVDITDRKRAEEALQQSNEKYRLLVEQQADAITMFNEQGKILDVNSSATQLLQYSREEFQQMTLLDVLSPEDVKQNPVDFALLQKGHTTIKQRRMRRKDGSLVETEVHAKLLGNGHFLASIRDLTERIDVQHRLEKEIALSDSIINSLPHLFYLFTKEGKYLRWNRQLQTVSGYSASEISEISPLQFFADKDKPLIIDAIEKVYQHGQSVVEAHLLTKHGKSIPYYFTGLAVEYAGSQCVLGVGIDLSVVKTLEEELSQQKINQQKKIMQAMIRAEEKEKNKLGLELHDNVNQILSVVRMYLTILDSDKPMEEITLSKTTQLLNTAIDEIRHLSHSLAVSYKFEAGLVSALEDMIEKVSLTRDFSISLCMSDELDEHTNNEQKLAIYRIVQEQLNNVIKYAKATEVKVEISVTPHEISVLVQDNGRGFNPAKAGKGLGISNIITRAEALEGRASIESAPGKGCRLMVSIPLHVVLAEEDN